MDHADGFHGLRSIQSGAAADRDEQDIDRPEIFHFSLSRRAVDVAHVSDEQPVDLKNENGVAGFTLFVRGMAGDENVVDLIFTGAPDHKGIGFDPGKEAVPGFVIAHGDDIRLQLQRFVTDFFIVIRIAYNASEISFSHAETRVSVPGNIHQSSKIQPEWFQSGGI